MLARSNATFIVIATLALALQPLIATARWLVVVRRIGERISMRQAVAITYIGTFFNQALPATVGGDAIRVWLCLRFGLPLASSITSVGLDRGCALLGLLIMVAISIASLAPHLEIAQLHLLAFALLIASLVAITTVVAMESLPASWRRWRAVRGLMRLAADTRRVLFAPYVGLTVLGLSILGILNMTVSVYFFTHAIEHPIRFLDAMLLVPPVLLASALPISIGGWGPREFAMVAALGTLGMPASASLVVSIMFGIASIFVSLPGAPLYLSLRAR